MNEGNGKIAQGRHDVGSVSRTQARPIFAKGHITHIMRGVLNPPVSADQLQQALWARLLRRQRSDKVDDFLARFPSLANRDRSCQFAHLLDERPVKEIGVHLGAQADGTLARSAPDADRGWRTAQKMRVGQRNRWLGLQREPADCS